MGINMRKSIKITHNYLWIPVKTQEELQRVSFCHGETKIYEFEIPVGKGKGLYEFHYYAAVPVADWKNTELILEGEVPESFMEAVALSDTVPKRTHKRPLIHFTPDTGWMNDPNGMIFHEGVYHLFFQHNPFDKKWENMSWGHAVSRDLLHWTQGEDVIFPDEDGTMYSGCGIVNEQEKLGLGKDAEIYVYTCAGSASAWSKGKKFVQKIAYSTDHGKTLCKRAGCILGHVTDDNRDPKVYWHEESSSYYMALYLEKNEYAIFHSEDLERWEMSQQLTLPFTWECPDLRRVPVEGGGSKWMFWGADGYYFLGDFDGTRFEMEGGRHAAWQSMLPYAAQSFWGTERVLMIPWLRTADQNKPYTGSMGIPRQLTLVKKGEDYCLRQKIADEFENAREKVLEGSSERIVYEQKEEAALEIKLSLKEGAGFQADIFGTVCTRERDSSFLKIEGIAQRSEAVWKAAEIFDREEAASERFCAPGGPAEELFWEKAGIRGMEIGKGVETISFLSDGEILEVTVDDGLACGAYETEADAKSGEVRIAADGEVKVEIFRVV